VILFGSVIDTKPVADSKQDVNNIIDLLSILVGIVREVKLEHFSIQFEKNVSNLLCSVIDAKFTQL
jgi:hypothetical protein